MKRYLRMALSLILISQINSRNDTENPLNTNVNDQLKVETETKEIEETTTK